MKSFVSYFMFPVCVLVVGFLIYKTYIKDRAYLISQSMSNVAESFKDNDKPVFVLNSKDTLYITNTLVQTKEKVVHLKSAMNDTILVDQRTDDYRIVGSIITRNDSVEMKLNIVDAPIRLRNVVYQSSDGLIRSYMSSNGNILNNETGVSARQLEERKRITTNYFMNIDAVVSLGGFDLRSRLGLQKDWYYAFAFAGKNEVGIGLGIDVNKILEIF